MVEIVAIELDLETRIHVVTKNPQPPGLVVGDFLN